MRFYFANPPQTNDSMPSIKLQRHRRSSDPVCPNACASFPPELWLKILSISPISSIKALSLTCKKLSHLAQPFLFQGIVFHPYRTGSKMKYYTERTFHRVAFLLLPRIAPAIQRCVITLGNPPFSRTTSLNTTLDLIFDALLGFPNISELVLHYLHLSRRHMAVVRRLSPRSLELQACTFGSLHSEPEELPIPLKTAIWNNGRYFFQPSPNPSITRILISPLHLEHLVIGPSNAESVLMFIAESDEPFNYLSTLEMTVDSLTLPYAMLALSRCPFIQRLCLRYLQRCPRHYVKSFPDAILPRLTAFEGPHIYVELLAQSRTLLEVTLWPFDAFSPCYNPGPLCNTLNHLNSQLEILDIASVSHITPSLLLTIQTSFPLLRSLAINAHPEASPRCLTISDLTNILIAFPWLETIRVGIQLQNDKPKALRKVLSTITTMSTKLRYVKMWYWNYPDPSWIEWDRGNANVQRLCPSSNPNGLGTPSKHVPRRLMRGLLPYPRLG
ncbi:hypothetical protein BD779DRAFT_151204 [Infundibulicybe gibba]|nr:hypothetical protein BD779DRAFT_151204 [Infundibulicybe gibba]